MYSDTTLTKLFLYSTKVSQKMHKIFSQYMILLDMRIWDNRLWLSMAWYVELGSRGRLPFSMTSMKGMHPATASLFLCDTIYPACS